MTTIKSRSAANLPAVPSSIGHRSLSSWAGIRVHHTGGAFSSWRAVHNWQTSGRPADGSQGQRLPYIGYSFGISSGDVWTLRGFDHHPAHDFINTHIGVVFGGGFESRLPSGEDLSALVWFVREAEQRCGKRLPISTHREVGQTTCPGSRLHQWIKQELPGRLATEEDDMPYRDWPKADREALAADVAHAVWVRENPTTGKQYGALARGLTPVPHQSWVRARWPQLGETTVERSVQASTYGHARRAGDNSELLLEGQLAILAAATGADGEAILAALEQHAQTAAAERQAVAGQLEARLDAAQQERAELAELVGQAQSGELDAAAVVDEIGRRLRADASSEGDES